MEGQGPRPQRRRRIDGTVLFGGLLSALLHVVGIVLLLVAPARLQPTEQTAYTVEVVDSEALGETLLAGPIGGASKRESEPPEAPRQIAKAVAAPERDDGAVALVTVQPTPRPTASPQPARPKPTARPRPKRSAPPRPRPKPTKAVKAAKRTPARKPASKMTAAPAPRQVAVARTERLSQEAAKKRAGAKKRADERAATGTQAAAAGGDATDDLDSRLSAAIAGIERAAGRGGEVRGLEFVAYYTQMLARIKDRWTWAGDRTDLRVTVRFSILPSGGIANLRLVERSGEESFDSSVRRAIKSASPFSPPPETYQRDFADIELMFRPADLEVSG